MEWIETEQVSRFYSLPTNQQISLPHCTPHLRPAVVRRLFFSSFHQKSSNDSAQEYSLECAHLYLPLSAITY